MWSYPGPDGAVGAVEARLAARGIRRILGVDEVGRGCLAGPVVAAAVALPPHHGIEGLDDSKRLSASRREALERQIRACALAIGIGHASAREVDQVNVLQASLKAMVRAVTEACGSGFEPEQVIVDGNREIPARVRQVALVGADHLSFNVAAASIVAKVWRDREMAAHHQRYPQYGFDRHVGYATARHREALARHGPCPLHRTSFAPVARAIAARG